ncbi:MAG: nucleotidyl transferase AbiEii/AbiGii toxin family protein [Candidatus Omnitrophica bacterium]|nr:nucleotidyl transferase AbiEii/AbiGii toxin family protein [Candidatus Omnitrophota bacterium]
MDNNKLNDVINFIADEQGFRPAIIEKDYHLTMILNSVNEHLSRDIVFKGGTLLNKVYLNYHRLSEDLDFSYRNDIDVSTRSKRSKAITPIRKKMPSFLSFLGLTSDNPKGEGFNNSAQYLFKFQYPSIILKRKENIKFEISLRQPSFLPPIAVPVKHFYQDPFNREDLFPQGTILALSLEESVAEKLKAAISRLTPAIRDYYDLGHFIKTGFDFARPTFLKMVNEKLRLDGYMRDYSRNLGLQDAAIEELKRTLKGDLAPMIRMDEKFDLDKVLKYFNKLFEQNRG